MSSNNVPPLSSNLNSFDELSDDSNHTDSKINSLFSNVAKKVTEKSNDDADDSSEDTRGTLYEQFFRHSSLRHPKHVITNVFLKLKWKELRLLMPTNMLQVMRNQWKMENP